MITYPQWEYHVEERVTQHEALFSSYGRKGWELVTCSNEFGKVRYIFKRPIPSAQSLIPLAPEGATFYNTHFGKFYKWDETTKVWAWHEFQKIWLNIRELPNVGVNVPLN